MTTLLQFQLGLKSKAFLLSALVFGILQIWRPCFFLTDDSMSGGMPIFDEIGRHMWAGQPIGYSDYIFGGNYWLAPDPMFFTWGPTYLFVSFLCPVIGAFYYADLLAFFNLQLAIIGFVALGEFLRKEYALKLSDWRLLFYALSFNFNLYVLDVGSSWGNFLVNHSVLPWLVLALMQKTLRSGWAMASLFLTHELVAGHVVMTISSGILFSIFALGYSSQQRSWRPTLIWLSGNLTTGLIVLPLLIPALTGFAHSHRADGLSAEIISTRNIPLTVLCSSVFLGEWNALVHLKVDPNLNVPTLQACTGFAAAWCLIPTLLTRRRFSKLEQLVCYMILIVVVLVTRPYWVSEIIADTPILKSLRWPFREVLEFQFFLHLFLVIRPPEIAKSFQRDMLVLGLICFILPLFIIPTPALNQTASDRDLLFTGEARQYWAYVKTLIKPGEMIVPIVPRNFPLERQYRNQLPECLIGNCNYPVYFHVLSASGYSATAPLNNTILQIVPTWPYGSYTPVQIPNLLAIANRRGLHLRFIMIERSNPLQLSIITPGGEAIDLSDHIPERYGGYQPN